MTQLLLFNVTNGLIIGAFYVLMAIGLSLILNLSNVINFAHHRRHRLDALALALQHQANAIVAQRPGTIRMANHAHKPLDIYRKPRFTVASSVQFLCNT